ncbi:RNA-guided endonuclease InsQ/TnpB family protein [Streptomyces pseudovenezuelae]|uniref:Transposase n=1 Tax=Streptomyces pseudovenezuelae TaxID=67350 RepID=A0ABT6LQK4_9ACTN|nr:transposase [Streptomyces pseudovenezuelae]MDH6218532.1 putative transposase [Streptomyces pseudovenezuelae]
MKLAVRVKLLPTPEQASALEATLRACNEAANWLSSEAFTQQVTSRAGLQASAYADLRARGLSAQPALHVVRKVADAYAALKAKVWAGNLGAPGSERCARSTSKPITFGSGAAQPFDDRCLSWQVSAATVSTWTVGGRLKGIAFAGHPKQVELLARYRRGESDLLYRNGQWYLTATCEIPEVDENKSPAGLIGVDLGIVNIATTSTGKRHRGRRLNRCREQDRKLRGKLQRKGTKSAKRRAKRHAGREARRARDINHKISKCILAEAQRTGRGIALEDLGGIRERVRLKKPQRVRLHSWAFHRLGQFIAYKAKRVGVPVVQVDPAHTSRECSRCHHVDRRNRPSQAVFVCGYCGFAEHADLNASHNIAARGW